jgi:hypothetical protein
MPQAAAAAVIVLAPCLLQWPAVGSWWTIMLVFAFQSGAVVGSALLLYSVARPQLFISLLACCDGPLCSTSMPHALLLLLPLLLLLL